MPLHGDSANAKGAASFMVVFMVLVGFNEARRTGLRKGYKLIPLLEDAVNMHVPLGEIVIE